MKLALIALLVGCASSSPPAPGTAVSPIAISSSAAKAEPAAPGGVKLTAMDPAKGDIEGGTYTRLTGTHLLPIAQSSKIFFGAREGTIVRISSDSELIVLAPAGPAGQVVDVRVVFEGGEVTLPHAFTYVAKP